MPGPHTVVLRSAFFLAAFAASPALADDDDDLEFDDDIPESTAPKPAPAPAPPPADEPPPIDDEADETLRDFKENGTEGELFEDDRDRPVEQEGQDTSAAYREAQQDYAKLPPDEESMAWERYLRKYPNSLYKDRIAERMEKLLEDQYARNVDQPIQSAADAGRRELYFTQPLTLETVNPRTRLLGGFEWGVPGYIAGKIDYEHQILRSFSAHAGINRRMTGWGLEPGVKWAVLKSAKTNTVVSLLGDLRLNFGPFFAGVRPQVAFGQIVGPFEVQAQVGIDAELRKYPAINLIGGVHMAYRINKSIGVFLESRVQHKHLTRADGAFGFDTVSFGLKFYPKVNKTDTFDRLEVDAGASVPYVRAYWQPHFGAINGQIAYYDPWAPVVKERTERSAD